jgi:hypothetical protein
LPLTPPAPSPVPSFAKGLVHWLNQNLIDPYRYLYTWIAGATDVVDMQWRYVTLRFQRATPVGTVEDYAQFGFHIINITNGDIDKSWTAQDYTDCEAALNEWFAALATYFASSHTLVDYRWYVKQFAANTPWGQPASALDPATGKPYARFAKSGAPERVTPKGLAGGSSAAALPYQSAMSITLKTPAPRHWGRVYLPAPTIAELDSYSRWGSAISSVIANQTAELVDDLAAKQFQLIVPTTQIGSVLSPNIEQVSEIVVDDVPDVIRRRRPKQAHLRTVGVPLP